ncbi:hypothetical protein R1sor_026089 [Riccia sorocarpa]|uniref:Uncharacterized protein n=1 Tax=Riccia sorocarpa TaxID=122646 RepID=A0ABD3GC01_9MARC
MPPSQYADMEDSWEITGVPAMRALKKEYLQELSDGLSRKTVTAIRGLKSARSSSTDRTEADADHECADPPEFPKDATSTWLALKL